MHVLVDGTLYLTAPSGGGFQYLNELLPRLSKLKGLEVELMLPKGVTADVPTVATKKALVPTATWFPSGKLKQSLGVIKRQLEASLWVLRMKKEKELLFHSVYYEDPPSQSWRVVSTLHDMITEKFPEFYANDFSKSLTQKKLHVLKESARVIAISEQTKKDITEITGMSANQIDVVPHGINTSIFNPIGAAKTDKPYLLYVGGRMHHKNFSRLIEAYASGPLKKDVKLVVAGFPWQSEEEELLKKWGLSKSIDLIEKPSVEKLATLYRNASVFVYPSLYEGFGMPLLEAMASGTPVVTSGVGCLLEVGGPAALYFDPTDIGSIQKKIEEALNPNTAGRLAQLGLERAKEFSWEKSAELTYKTYQKALA